MRSSIESTRSVSAMIVQYLLVVVRDSLIIGIDVNHDDYGARGVNVICSILTKYS